MVSRKVRGATAVTLAALVGALGGMPAVSWADTLAKTDAAKTEQAAATEAATTQAATTEAKSGDQVALASETAPDSQEGKAAATNGKFYDTVQEAIDAAETDGTVWVYGNTDENVTVSKKVSITGVGDATEQAFSGTITFVAGSEGSVVSNVHFTYPVAEGTHNAVVINGTSDITVSDNTFEAPSALLKGKEWQRNGVWAQSAKSVSINQNKFNLGRLNDTNGSGDVAADSNSNAAVNLVGGGDGNVSDVRVTNNILTVTAPDGTATRDASVNLLIANGNSKDGQYGVKDVTVENNTYNGSADAANANTRFAGISNVSGITFTKNTVSYAARGVAQSVWQGNTSQNDDVTVGEGNTFSNVASPFEAKTVPSEDQQTGNGAFVTKADGTFAAYGWVSDAVNAINSDDSFAGATLTINKNLYDHQEFTFNKKVTVTTTPGSDFTFNGSIRLNASGSVVKGVHFVLDGNDLQFVDGKVSGVRQNVIISSGAYGVEVSGNTFDLPSIDKGDVDFQLSSVWLEQGVTNSKITGNAFNIGRAYWNSNVGINFVGNANAVIKNTVVSNNRVTFTEDNFSSEHTDSDYGDAIFVVANGNAGTQSPAVFGVEGITAEGNTVDGSKLARRDYAFSISNVKGAEINDNQVSGVYMAVSPSYYPAGKTYASTDLTFKRNKLKDNTANVYFDPLFTTGDMTSDDISYGGGADANTVEISDYTGARTPYVSGLAFAGWYDANDHVATKDTTTAYAKFVPVSDVVRLMGGSLNMGAYATADGEPDYSKTDLRFGFNVVVPNSSSKLDSWRWVTTYTKPDGTEKTLTTEGANFRAPNSAEAGKGFDRGVVTNLLLTGATSAIYGTDFTTTLTVTYTTDDGTQVTVSDSPQTRSVKEVAELIKSSTTATDEERAYAEGILGAMN